MRNHREEVARALRLMGELNDVIQDTHGNVSCVDDYGYLYIKPSGVPYKDIHYNSVAVLNDEIAQVKGDLKPSVDTVHHKAIYDRWPNIKAICHTHSPYATAYAYNQKPIRCLGTEQADFFGDDVYVMSYSDLNCWGEEAAKYLHIGVKATLLHRHGTLTFGETPEQAVKLAAALENCARKNYLAETLFNNDSRVQLDELPDSEVKKWHARYYTEYGQ